jgi:acetyl-CoA acyltransferase
MPEAEQGLNVGRFISLMGLNTNKVPGMTVNRYCSSGIETMAIAKAKIEAGLADVIIAGGTESMSAIAMGGWRVVPNAKIAKVHADWYWGMGNTAEEVAKQFGVSREAQDEFSVQSHLKALKAINEGKFESEIVPIHVNEVYIDENGKRAERTTIIKTDEGPRIGTSMEGLSKLRPVFDAKGTVTAGNASQMSDGAAFCLMMSEEMVKKLNLQPIARLVSYKVVGVEPRIMGIGPVKAIPGAVEMAGLKLNDIDLFELNEAFASQSLAVIKETGIDPTKVNVNGGAIALGHPLGCTGAKLSVQIMNELKRTNGKYGVVTMCIGTGQGAAGVIELL